MVQAQVLIQEYREIIEKEKELARRKQSLRMELLRSLDQSGRRSITCEHGTALQMTRFDLTPKRDPVLALLDTEDLFPFTRFYAKRVQEVLVPKYGRETVKPLFEVKKKTVLMVKSPNAERQG